MTLPPKPKTDAEVDGAVSALLRLRQESEEVRADLERLEGEVAVAQGRLRDVDAASLREASDRLHLGVAGTQMSPDPRGQVPGHARSHAGLDVLTALPNRDVMMGRFVQAIEVAKRTGSRIALLFIDLDHFKRVNDTFGHSAGDAVLKQVAGCLAGAVREVDTVSRHGGDEFLVLMPDISDVAEAERVAGHVVAALQAAGASSEHCPGLAASIGISVYPEDGDSPTVLIDRADAAMYVAKRRGTGHVVAHGHAASRGRAVRDPGPVKLVSSAADRAPSPKRPQATPADLRDANGALVRAAIGAQELQVAAELSLRKQKEYLACVAHELRNPLAPLSVAVSLLRGGDAAAQAEMQGIIERQVTHMSRLVGDLLDLSRGETGKLRIHPGQANLAEIVDDAVGAIRPSIEDRAQSFQSWMPQQPFTLVADSMRLVQVLSNLLDNASKYTPLGGDIRLAAEILDDDIVITVSDNGIGISAEALAAVFEPFVQEPHATGFSGTGLGIGLTVVRELVQLHGGRVVARSKGTGLGSQFIVTLPLAGNGTGDDPA